MTENSASDTPELPMSEDAISKSIEKPKAHEKKGKAGLIFSSRTRSRVCVMKLLYQFFLTKVADRKQMLNFLNADFDYQRCNKEYFDTLFYGVFDQIELVLEELKPFLDRPIDQVTPIERSILVLSLFEMTKLSTPQPVVINEAIQIVKAYGGVDGYKYINTILDKVQLPSIKT